eukprot:gene26871-biopygen17456
MNSCHEEGVRDRNE